MLFQKVLVILSLAMAPLSAENSVADSIPGNEIWYTSTDGSVVRPKPSAFPQNVVSNIYKDGKGVITFDGEIYKIGVSAFNGSTNLKTIQIPNGVGRVDRYAFYQCKSLETVSLPETVEDIKDVAFSECRNLKKINLPKNLTRIGSGAFRFCESLEEVSMEDKVGVIQSNAFENCVRLRVVRLSQGLREIGDCAFLNCEKLTEITVPSRIKYIGTGVFAGCNNIRSFSGKLASADGRCLIVEDNYLRAVAVAGMDEFVVPAGIKMISESAFSHLSLKRIVIPDGVEAIYDSAFAFCEELESISIPGTVTSIGAGILDGCNSLKKIEGPLSAGNGRALVLKDVLVAVAPYGINHYKVPEGVKKIGKGAFGHLTAISQVSFPKGLTSIRERAFEGCTGLVSVSLPESLKYVLYQAFKGCESLTRLDIKAKTPPELEDAGTFDYIETICVPQKSIELYKSAPQWNGLFDKMEGR